MIDLMQHKVDIKALSNNIVNNDEIKLNLNKDLIARDIQMLTSELKHPHTKCDKINLEKLKTYLNRLINKLDEDGSMETCWRVYKNHLETYPINLINQPLYKINCANYINVADNCKMVHIDTTDLADIISFEIMFREFGEDHNSIEELLKDCGIIGYEDSTILTDYFKENNDNIYYIGSGFRVSDTPYYSQDTKKVKDYFGCTEFKSDSYKPILDYSCLVANSIIMNTIVKNCINNKVAVKPLMVSTVSIDVLLENIDEQDIRDNILEDVSIRAFGRKFKIDTKAEIF